MGGIKMGYTGNKKPTNKILVGGIPMVEELKIETVTNMYPGRLVTKGTNDDDIIVDTAVLPPYGWLGYEQANPAFRPASVDTIYTAAEDLVPVLNGGGFKLVGSLAAPFSVNKGDMLANWAAGQLVGPMSVMPGGLALKIPFDKQTSEYDTGIDLPANMQVIDAFVEVVTAVASGTIDVGLLSSESGGDADGILDGVSCATAGIFGPTNNDTSTGEEQVGALLGDEITSADGTAEYTLCRKAHRCDGTAKSVTFTTSNHAIDGYIHLVLAHPYFRIVAQAQETMDASAAAKDIMVRSVI
jgi:hypothetical protein